MIRVEILAASLHAAEAMADLLAGDDRLEVLDARTMTRGLTYRPASGTDVLLSVGIAPDELPSEGPPVVALSDANTGEAPGQTGVHALLPMHASATEIAAAVVAVSSGFYLFTPGQMPRTGAAAASRNGAERLTRRELEVLRMMADGLANKEIAGMLGLSDHTVKFHVSQVLAKLDVASRTEAVRVGIRRGLLTI